MIAFQIFIFVAYFGRLVLARALPVPVPNPSSKHGLGERAERLSGPSLDSVGIVGGNVIVSNVIGSIHEGQKNDKALSISSEEQHELSRKIEKLFLKESSSHSTSSSEERPKMIPNVIHHQSPKSSISHQGIKNSHYNSKNKFHIFHLYPQDKEGKSSSSSRSFEKNSRSGSSESRESRDKAKLQRELSKRIQEYIKSNSKQYEDRSKSREKYSSESYSRERSRPQKHRKRNSRERH